MPSLDMSDALTDPDFLDSLVCVRGVQTVGENGVAALTQQTIKFFGVVTMAGGDELNRQASGEYIKQTIRVITKFALTDGMAGQTADSVQWNGSTYTVIQADDYSNYGQGFTQATCVLQQLSG